MTLVIASRGSTHFPAPPNPQTANADPISGGAPGAIIGSPGINPLPNALAGCIGTFTVNGVSIGSETENGPGLDLTQWQQQDVVHAINAALGGAVVASITPQGRIQLQSAPGVQISIGGSANILTALGFTAGGFIG